MFWAHRAKAEIEQAQRSWFGTLTLTAEAQATAQVKAVKWAMRHGLNWNDMEPGDQFAAVHRQIGPELTKWLKRVRKVSGARLRYLLVVEAHEGGGQHHGMPHYHCLVHEVLGSAPVTERQLRFAWARHGGGFTEFKLVRQDDPRAAFYVCKYLSKNALARVRASARYGLWGPGENHGTHSVQGTRPQATAQREVRPTPIARRG